MSSNCEMEEDEWVGLRMGLRRVSGPKGGPKGGPTGGPKVDMVSGPKQHYEGWAQPESEEEGAPATSASKGLLVRSLFL